MKLKVLVIGPCKSGKTTICNTVADIADNTNEDYHPTKGLRILELELKSEVLSDQIPINIELFDCSGSPKYQLCWPVFQLDAQAIVFVYNPQTATHLAELELLYDSFVMQTGLSDSCCILLANQTSTSTTSLELPNKLKRMMHESVNVITDPNTVKTVFINFVDTLMSACNRQL